MGFWKSFFGGEEPNPEEEKKNAEAKNFDTLKYDGVRAMRIGQSDFAAKCFREALKINDDLETHNYLLQLLIHTNQYDEALDDLKALSEKHPENISIPLQAAHVAYLKEDYTLMSSLCEQALAIDGNHAVAHHLMGQACLGQGDMVGGIARLTKAIALDEDLGDARLLRAQTLLKMGDANGAQDDCDWLLAHTEEQEEVLLLSARLQHAKGNDDDATSTYNQIIELNPFQIDAYRERGKIRFDRGDKQGAEEDLQKVLELDPQALNSVSGEYEAEGIEQKVKQAYTFLNPFGL